jgi:hypothetical protein
VWGVFDPPSLDAQLRRRVLAHECARRRPDLSVRAFTTVASDEGITGNDVDPLEPLTGADAPRRNELAAGLDLVVSTFDLDALDALPPESAALLLEGPGPPTRIAWHAIRADCTPKPDVVAAAARADHLSLREHLGADLWGATNGRAEDARVAHPALLTPRLFERRLLEARRAFLRAIDAWPADERPLVVQGSEADRQLVAALRTLARHSVVTLPAHTPAEATFSAAVASALGPEGRELPEHAGVEDVVAAIAGAAGVIATSEVTLALARAFGIPHASSTDLAATPTGTSIEEVLGASAPIDDDVARLDADLDGIMRLAPGPGPGRLEWSEILAARAALDARGRRLSYERVAFADAMVAERARFDALQQQLGELQAGYDDIRRLEVVRWRIALSDLRRRLWRRKA